MKQITSITGDSKQRMVITLDDNIGSVEFKLYYMPTQYSWYYDFTYNNYVSNGNKVVLNLNALRHLRKILPFGFLFEAEGNIEPFAIDDFVNGRIRMYVLNEQDVKDIEVQVYG